MTPERVAKQIAILCKLPEWPMIKSFVDYKVSVAIEAYKQRDTIINAFSELGEKHEQAD